MMTYLMLFRLLSAAIVAIVASGPALPAFGCSEVQVTPVCCCASEEPTPGFTTPHRCGCVSEGSAPGSPAESAPARDGTMFGPTLESRAIPGLDQPPAPGGLLRTKEQGPLPPAQPAWVLHGSLLR